VVLDAGDTGVWTLVLADGSAGVRRGSVAQPTVVVLPLLADLASDHRVLAPDSPGFGASAAPRVAYSPAWYAAWLEAFQRATGSRGAVLIGNSLGGRIALEAGLTSPSSVRALVLLAPSPAFRRLRQYVPVVRLVDPRLAAFPFPTSSRVVAEGIRAMFSDPSRLPEAWYEAAADETVRVLSDRAHRIAFLSCARHIYLEDAYGRNGFWQRLTCCRRRCSCGATGTAWSRRRSPGTSPTPCRAPARSCSRTAGTCRTSSTRRTPVPWCAASSKRSDLGGGLARAARQV
jgi:pimeloyl-ACP methyl ester carboxylesterase